MNGNEAKTRARIRDRYANRIELDLHDVEEVVTAVRLDTLDSEHTGPYGGVQQRIAIVLEDGRSALVVIYSDDRTDEVVDELVAERTARKARAARIKEALG